MKRMIFLFPLCLLLATNTNGQVLKRLGDRAKQKMENKAGEKVEKSIDNAVDAKKKSKPAQPDDDVDTDEPEATEVAKTNEPVKKKEEANVKSYATYDFIPGTRVVFEDNLANEQEGEFPSLFTSTKGQVQVVTFKGEKVIQSFGCSDIIPRIKGSAEGKDVLPEQFTIEFDAHFPAKYQEDWWWLNIRFLDQSDPKQWDYNKEVPKDLYIDQKLAKYERFNSQVPEEKIRGGWNRIAIAVNKNMLKVYINESRTINSPALQGDPRSITIEFTPNGCHDKGVVAIKNFRIAEGGMDLYKRSTIEGNFVARGIYFDYNKATIKPESMGELNRIVKFLGENTDMKFEIGGHTDSDGDDQYNLKLSQQRADAVKAQLVKMGIDESRLTTKGYGETMPLAENNSPEAKANNRRVEFRKT